MAAATFIQNNQGNLDALTNFIIDNNSTAVFAVLRSNGFTFNTAGEASVILKSLFGKTDEKSVSIVAQLSKVPYLNNATNGTGGLRSTNGGMQTLGAGDDLLCLGSKLFGLSIGCPPTVNPADTAALQAATQKEAEARAKAQRTTYIVIGISAVVILVLVIYFTKKK